MNAAVKQKHILQAVDWSRFDLEGWLYQFGAWQDSVKGTCGKSLNPIATAMDQAVSKRKKLKMGVKKKRQIIADAMCSDLDFLLTKKQTPKDIVCQISDDEARAVQRYLKNFIEIGLLYAKAEAGKEYRYYLTGKAKQLFEVKG